MKIKLTAAIFIAVFIALAGLYYISPQVRGPQIQGLGLFFSAGAAVIGIYTSRIYGFRSANGRALLLIAGGLVCWATAEVIWYVSDTFIVSGTIAPSLADIFFLLGYPFFGVGVYQGFITAGIKLKTVNKSLLYIVLIVSLVLTSLVAHFGVYQAFDPEVDTLTNVVNISYGIGDLVLVIFSLLTILVASEYKDGKLASFWKAIAIGFLLILIADIVFAIYGENVLADVKPYTYVDLVWEAGYQFLAFAMLENYLHISAVQQNIRLRLLQRK